MLLRIAQGDSYCLATEYIKHPRDTELQEKVLKFDRYYKHPNHSLKPGQYSDDTQLSIAVTEVLMLDGAQDMSEATLSRAFVESFVRCFKRDPRDGYSRGFQAILEEIQNADEFVLKIVPNSDKNGACMRAVPIGVLPNVEDVLAVSEMQAKITHNTPEGVWSAQAVAMMSHFALHSDKAFSEMGQFCTEYFDEGFSDHIGQDFNERVCTPHVAIKTVQAAYHAIIGSTNLLDVMRKIILWGGDTDTVAAVAWGIASTRMTENLPPFFDGGLEDGEFGRDFLLKLGTDLMERYSG